MNPSLQSSLSLAVKVGGRELVTSGVIHLEQSEYEIEINNLKFAFCFKDDDGESRYNGRVENNTLYIDLYNHNNSLGEGVFTPLEIGLINDQKLSITYYVSTVSKEEKKRRFEFAIYLGDA